MILWCQSTEQLLNTGCKTHQFIRSTFPYELALHLRIRSGGMH